LMGSDTGRVSPSGGVAPAAGPLTFVALTD
jgi:hypothetical protein